MLVISDNKKHSQQAQIPGALRVTGEAGQSTALPRPVDA